jgi:O-antigen/teichoic acid export membrane protein
MVGTGLTSVLGFVFWVLAAHLYPARLVGLSSAVIAAMGAISGFCTLGLDAVLVRYLPTAGRWARPLVVRSYSVTIAASLLAGAVAAATSSVWSPRLRFLGQSPEWLVGFALATAVWTVFTLEDSVLTGVRSPQWIPLENSLYSLVKLILLFVLAGALPRAGMFLAWTAPAALTLAGFTVLIFGKLIPRQASARPAASLDRRVLTRVAAGNYAGMVCLIAGTALLPVIVANETNLALTAYFYVPWTIITVLRLIAANVMISLTVEGALDEPGLGRLTRRAFLHTMRIVLPLIVVCLVAAPWILRLFGAGYADAGSGLLRLLALGSIPNVIVALGIGVARVRHEARVVFAIQAAEGILMVALSFALLPSAGIEGVGIAWLVSQAVIAAVLLAGPLGRLMLRGKLSPTGAL